MVAAAHCKEMLAALGSRAPQQPLVLLVPVEVLVVLAQMVATCRQRLVMVFKLIQLNFAAYLKELVPQLLVVQRLL
jgi:hypothetical protein